MILVKHTMSGRLGRSEPVADSTLNGTVKYHLPGSGVCDTQTLCGSSGLDDGEFETVRVSGLAKLDCAGCMDQAVSVLDALCVGVPPVLVVAVARKRGR